MLNLISRCDDDHSLHWAYLWRSWRGGTYASLWSSEVDTALQGTILDAKMARPWLPPPSASKTRGPDQKEAVLNAPSAAHDKRPVVTHGSLMRHVAVMTATGAIGLMAVFVVDLLSLFWVSKLGDQAFKAAVGYVGLMTFFVMSINIGLTIAASATVSRALGAGDRPRARRLAASSLIITAVFSAVMAAAMFVLRDWILVTVLHAHGESAEVASKFIAISIPANVPLAVGMTFSGILRAVADARRAMYVTLSAGIATAFLDPLLIFGLGLGVYGAAWATVLSRLILLGVGWLGAVGVHDLVARPKLNAARGDFGPIMAI